MVTRAPFWEEKFRNFSKFSTFFLFCSYVTKFGLKMQFFPSHFTNFEGEISSLSLSKPAIGSHNSRKFSIGLSITIFMFNLWLSSLIFSVFGAFLPVQSIVQQNKSKLAPKKERIKIQCLLTRRWIMHSVHCSVHFQLILF